MQVIEIKGQIRNDLGKKGAREARKQEMIPCVMYGAKEVVHFTTTPSAVKNLVYTPDFKVAEVEVDGKKFKCILKDKQFHPVTDAIQHLDFLMLIEGHPIKVEVPIRFKGVSPGVKSGGKLVQKLRTAKIKALPEKLVDEVTVDISKLEMGQSIRIREIEPGEGIEILNSPGVPIATIEIPRALRSAQQAAAAAEKKK